MNEAILFFLVLLLTPQASNSLSTEINENPSRGAVNFVKIVGFPGGGTQSLPTSYVQNHIRRWQLRDDKDGGVVEKDSCQQSDINFQIRWKPSLQYRPVLDVLIKGGVPNYVMAGVMLRDINGNENTDSIRARPLARQWTSIQFAAEPNFRMEVFQYQHSRISDEYNDCKAIGTQRQKISHKGPIENVSSWKIGEDQDLSFLVQKTLERFAFVMSELNHDSELLEGFNIVSTPLPVDWCNVLEPESSSSSSDGSYSVACLATAEPDAQALLTLDQDLLEITASSILEMTILASD